VSDWFTKQGRRERLVDWLSIDSWIDSSLATAWGRVRDGWDAGTSFFARFRLTGWKRLLNEFVSEGLTLGAGGLVVLYALALPALQEVEDGKWLSTGKYSVTFLDVQGNEIGKRGINLNDAVPLEEIPDHLIKATLATEDRRFFEHFGVDFIGTARALGENLRANEVVQGGSTLTQQLAKNLFLSSERSVTRKLKEVFLAFWLESRLSKREILKMYLDRAYMGGGAFGVEAAAQFYFGKSVREVSLAEAALMAGLFKAPTKFAPHVNLPASKARTADVLSNLVEAGFYTSGQVHEARLNPAVTVEQRRTDSPDWYLDWAFEEIQRVMEGRGHYVLTARTTVDLSLQRQADEVLISTIKNRGKSARFDSGAIVAMETDGAVRAIAGGRDYGESQFNRATQSKRQPGSSFKVYVYAAALENGYNPNSIVRDASRSCGNWHPQNYGGSHGSGGAMPLWMALAKSYNTTAAELSFVVGRAKVIEMTRRLGIRGIRPSCSMALGDYGISPLEHAGALATFANGGKSAKPYAILEATNSKGELVYSRDRDEPAPAQLVSRRVAEGMNQMMHKVVTEGTGKSAGLDFTHVVGKTGTSTGPKDVWFVGYTGKLVGVVWFGNDDNRAMANGTTGGQFAAPAWQQLMSIAHGTGPIPVLPGLAPHPNQIGDQQRLAEMRRNEQATAGAAAATTQRRSSLMPDRTREALRKIDGALRKAAGLAPPPQQQGSSPSESERPAGTGQPPGRRAEAPSASDRDVATRGRP
jgi:penicillin-binding protein 1A